MKQWSIAKLNRERAGAIANNYDLPPIIATLLDIRGFSTEDEIQSFLYEENFIESPFEIKDMDKACKRIRQAIDRGEKICVYGDYDADGVTSTALLYSYFDTIGVDVMYYIPSRESEGYGMNIKAIDYLSECGVNLIVTVDNGIAAINEIKYANEKGIDTVVTDHHLPSDVLPEAVAVVDLHRTDCKSKFKLLSGVGVAFKLVYALEGEYADLDMLLDNYSDLVALGTIGDIVPLVGENRVFVKRGLVNLANTDRPGISALMEEAGLIGKELTSGKVSFTLVPRINAVGRLGLSKDSLSLLLSEGYEAAQELSAKLGEDNTERQNIEKEIIEKINILVRENPQIVRDKVLVIDGEGWHQGVIGIVSSRIKDIYGKPCIVLSRDGEMSKGSGRSIEGFDLWEAINSCSHLLTKYGGHTMAVGLSLESKNIDLFRKAVNNYAQSCDMPFATLNIDCKLNPAFLNVEIAKQLKYLQPFGAGNPTPIFQLSNMKIDSVVPLSANKHIKINFINNNTNVSAVYFFCSKEEFPYKVGEIVDLAVTLDVNVFRDKENLSIIIKDIKFSQVDNKEYLQSERIFEEFYCGKKLTKAEILSLIPTRNDFALVYRYLKNEINLFNIKIENIAYRLQNQLSYGKIKVILYAMREKGLIEIYEDMKEFKVTINQVQNKVDIESSQIIVKLKEAYDNE